MWQNLKSSMCNIIMLADMQVTVPKYFGQSSAIGRKLPQRRVVETPSIIDIQKALQGATGE